MGNSDSVPKQTQSNSTLDDETSKLEPRVKQFLYDSTPYTSYSISKTEPVAQQSSQEAQKRKEEPYLDPDLAVKSMKLFPPMFPGPKTKKFFSAKSIEAFPNKMQKVDLWPILLVLEEFQIALNESSVKIATDQAALTEKIKVSEILCAKVLHNFALLGSEIQNFGVGINNIHHIEHSIRLTNERIHSTLRRTFHLLDCLPQVERADLIPSFDIIKPFIRKDEYVQLNLYPMTKHFNGLPPNERLAEDFWLEHILPHWDEAILQKKAIAHWRSGIPIRLRAYVWQRLIGNRLEITPDIYSTWQQNALQKFGNVMDEELSDESEVSDQFPKVDSKSDLLSHPDPSVTLEDSQTDEPQGKIIEYVADEHPKEEISNVEPSNESETSLNQTQESTGNGISETASESPEAIVEEPPIEEILLDKINEESIRNHLTVKKANVRHLIMRDIPRTFPDLKMFEKRNPAYLQLLTVLETASIFSDIGYVQGMSYICGGLLMFMNHYDCFLTFTNLIHSPFLKSVCKIDLGLIAKHSQLFQMVFLQNMPILCNHFRRLGVSTEHFLLDWWLTLFSKSVPLPVAFRIWDCFLIEGELFLHFAAVGILKIFEQELLKSSFETCLDLLSQIPKRVTEDALFSCIRKFTHTPKIQAIIDEMHPHM